MSGAKTHSGDSNANQAVATKWLIFSLCGFRSLAALIGTLTGLLLMACDIPPQGTTSESSPREKTMILPTATLAPRPTLPPIDRNLTADVQTATFALG